MSVAQFASRVNSNSLRRTPQSTPTDTRQWRQIINILGARGARFVEIKRGSKLPTRKGWNQTENTLDTKIAKAHIAKGDNVGLATGTGNLYILDFDYEAERGHESDHLSGGLHTWRENAPHKAKFVFFCPDPIPTRLKSKTHGIDLLGINANGSHAQGVIAGVHDSGAAIQWAGHTIPVLPAVTVAALWAEWTGADLFAPEREEREENFTYANAALARVADALKHVDPDEVDYTQWQGIIAALHDTFGDEALETAAAWANGKPGEVETKWGTYDRDYTGKPTTLATIFYLARKGGWPDTWLTEKLSAYRERLATPGTIADLKELGFKNPEKARKLLDSILEYCEKMKSLTVTPGYAWLSKACGIATGGIAPYLARLFTSGFIELKMGKKGGEGTQITLVLDSVLHNLNSFTPPGTTIQVVQNWNIYREERPKDAYIENHHAYSSTRTMATLPTLGSNGLGAILALQNGPITTKEAANTVGYTYEAMARTLRRLAAHDAVDVEVGERNLKTYTLKENWREILKANAPKIPTYGVGLARTVNALKSLEKILLHKGEEAKAAKVKADHERMKVLLDKVKADAGIVEFVSLHHPNKHEARRRRLTHMVIVGNQAENRPTHRKLTAGDRWRHRQYAALLPTAQAHWQEFNAWATVEYGSTWFVGLTQTDVLGRYQMFEYAAERTPTIQWVGA